MQEPATIIDKEEMLSASTISTGFVKVYSSFFCILALWFAIHGQTALRDLSDVNL